MNYIEEMMKMLDIGYIGECQKGIEYAKSCNKEISCEECEFILKQYPDFTPKKQLEIIKLICNKTDFYACYKGNCLSVLSEECDLIEVNNTDFSQALAELTTKLIKANESDKQEVKRILKDE